MDMMTAGLALVAWTFVMWVWMYVTRLSGLAKLGTDVSKLKRAHDMDDLPDKTKWVADNFNHLHEQPVLFYFLVVYSSQVGVEDSMNIALAWAFVGFRVLHSLCQATTNFVPVRFTIYIFGSICIWAIAARNLFDAFAKVAF